MAANITCRLVPQVAGLKELEIENGKALGIGRHDCGDAAGQSQISRRQVEVRAVEGGVTAVNVGQGRVRLIGHQERLLGGEHCWLQGGTSRKMEPGDTLQLCAISVAGIAVVASWTLSAIALASFASRSVAAPDSRLPAECDAAPGLDRAAEDEFQVRAQLPSPLMKSTTASPHGTAMPPLLRPQAAPLADPTAAEPRRETLEKSRTAPPLATAEPQARRPQSVAGGTASEARSIRSSLGLTTAIGQATDRVLGQWDYVPRADVADETDGAAAVQTRHSPTGAAAAPTVEARVCMCESPVAPGRQHQTQHPACSGLPGPACAHAAGLGSSSPPQPTPSPSDSMSTAGVSGVQGGLLQRGLLQRGLLQGGLLQRGLLPGGLLQGGLLQGGLGSAVRNGTRVGGDVQRGTCGGGEGASLPETSKPSADAQVVDVGGVCAQEQGVEEICHDQQQRRLGVDTTGAAVLSVEVAGARAAHAIHALRVSLVAGCRDPSHNAWVLACLGMAERCMADAIGHRPLAPTDGEAMPCGEACGTHPAGAAREANGVSDGGAGREADCGTGPGRGCAEPSSAPGDNTSDHMVHAAATAPPAYATSPGRTMSTRAAGTHRGKAATSATGLTAPGRPAATPPRRYALRERRVRTPFDSRPPPLGFRAGVSRPVPRREGGWPGGRLLITEVCGGAGRAAAARDSLPGTVAAEAESLTAAAEALYRERLPGLSVIQETQGGSKYDFVVDSMMHSAGAVTAVLQAGVADRHSAYVDGGDEASVVGAITLRVRTAPGRASPDGQSGSPCLDCGMADCDGGCADAGRAADGDGCYGEVLACAVSCRHMRTGVGRLLVAWATANAAAEGLRFLLVSASTDVVRFWERLGFGSPPTQCAEACRGLQQEFDGSVVLHLQVPAALGAAGCDLQVDESPLADAMAALRSRSRAAGHKRVRQGRGEPYHA